MNAFRLDRFTRALSTAPPRRVVLQGLAATVLGLAPGRPPSAVDAKKRKSKVRRNEFGCVEVGGRCRGRNDVCCSGICKGKSPKKGEKDKSRCVAHDTGDCQVGHQEGFCGGPTMSCTTSTGRQGVCDTTTGNASYCMWTGTCSPCSKDADCRPVCGRGAACVRCAACVDDGGTRCVGVGPDICIFS